MKKISKEKPKGYSTIALITIILITFLSVGILIIMSSSLLEEAQRYSETADIFDNVGNIAETEIQTILQEDTTRYESAFAKVNDLLFYNDKYYSMIQYNETFPASYSQKEFDEIKDNFALQLKSVISIVNQSTAYEYSTLHLNATYFNNFSAYNFENYLITNQWLIWMDPYNTFIHPDIVSYVEAAFASTGTTLFLPLINLQQWTYRLYNDLSVLEDLEKTKLLDYLFGHSSIVTITLTNLSITYLAVYEDGYITLSEKMDTILTNLNNTLITLALSGVLMGFATSFENLNYRRISLVIGLLIFVLAVIYFMSGIGTLISMAENEALLIGTRDFTFL